MARPRRGPPGSLIDLLAREPFRFDSRQALRILERRDGAATVAPVTFRSSLSLAFPVGDIESIEVAPRGRAPVVTVSFLGLGGASGPLPTPYTELVGSAARQGDTSGRDFLDIFNHRLVTAAMDMAKLFRPVLQRGLPQESNLAQQCYALMGIGMPAILKSIPNLAPTLLPLTALINQRPLSAHAIERAVTAHCGVRARVIPFRGDWLRLPADQRSAIGRRGRHRRLGQTATLGGRMWDQSAGIALELGPVSAAKADRLLPAAPAMRRRGGLHDDLVGLLAFLIQGELRVELRLLVETAGIVPSHLSRSAPLRLGWTSWLGRDPARWREPTRLGRSARVGTQRERDGAFVPWRYRLGGARRPDVVTVVVRDRDAAKPVTP